MDREAVMVLVDDRSKGVRLEVEQRGRLTRLTLELTNAQREQREGAAVSLKVFAEMLALRLPGRSAGC
jgi:hypothetical protein